MSQLEIGDLEQFEEIPKSRKLPHGFVWNPPIAITSAAMMRTQQVLPASQPIP
jgi:hypothetical protein